MHCHSRLSVQFWISFASVAAPSWGIKLLQEVSVVKYLVFPWVLAVIIVRFFMLFLEHLLQPERPATLVWRIMPRQDNIFKICISPIIIDPVKVYSSQRVDSESKSNRQLRKSLGDIIYLLFYYLKLNVTLYPVVMVQVGVWQQFKLSEHH